jgi:hypothetical protein
MELANFLEKNQKLQCHIQAATLEITIDLLFGTMPCNHWAKLAM